MRKILKFEGNINKVGYCDIVSDINRIQVMIISAINKCVF